MKQPALRTLSYTLAISMSLTPVASWAGVDIAQTPLMVGEPIAPNIMFILDDSGSMGWEHMPGTTATWSSAPVGGLPNPVSVNDIRLRASNINTQWYNPLISYEPWLKYDGSSYGNADYNNTMSVDPSGSAASGSINFKTKFTSWVTLTTGTSNTYGIEISDQIATSTSNTPSGRSTGLASANYQWRYSGFYYLTGTNEKTATHYTRYDFIYGCSTGTTCNNSQKQWRARQFVINSTNGVNGTATEIAQFDWTPYGGTTRSVEQELQNYANWFVYYRLRINMAKAAASRAFATLSEGYRIGFDTLQYNSKSTTPIYPIPVGTSEGKFLGTNKQNWFAKLMAANAYNGTSLREALGRSGEYFSDNTGSYKTTNGPYGSGSGKPLLTCRQNFAILTTDGYWNGNAATVSSANADNDSTNGTQITGVNDQKYTYEAKPPYEDSRKNTLADVAMYYWKRDLMTNLLNNVPATGKNPAFWQHMRTYGISIGEKGTLDPKDQNTVNGLNNGAKPWPEPGDNKQENIDDLWHAAVNSRGEFIVARDPNEFARALTNTLMEIASETKSEASGGVNQSEITTGGNKAYFSRYTSGQWDGDLFARSVGTDGQQNISSELWSAEAKLPAWASRNIWVNNNGTFQKLTGAIPGLSADVVNYLRGDQSKEEGKVGGTFRKRTRLLPAFINSQLVYVAPPEQSNFYESKTFAGASTYNSFVTSAGSRTPMIYIAGNNGMLHGFDADTGVEKFAFLTKNAIDSGTFTNYVKPKYGSPGGTDHKYILDGELSVADVYLSGGWKTVLVGTQGRGGKGVFALDVTNPNNITLLWEKTAADSGALGNNLGKPIITQVAAGDWRVIFGNGPNSTGDKAQLIMISLSSGTISAVDTGATGNNGLSGVNLWDADKDGIFETAYAGDLNGNLWRFNNLGGGASATKIFSAPSGQAITSTPLVVRNQKTDDTWVFVGSGRYLNNADLKNTDQQAWYGLIDKKDGVVSSVSTLLQRTVTADKLEKGSEGDILNNTGGKNRGWYINFRTAKPGERMMTPNFIIGGALFGVTFIPDAADPCEPKGSSSLWAVNPFSGANLGQNVFGTTGVSIMNDLSPITSGAPAININKGTGQDPGKFHIQLPTGTTDGTIPTGRPARQAWREVVAP